MEGMVFVGFRCPEHKHDAISHVLVNNALVNGAGTGDKCEIAIQHIYQLFRFGLFRYLSEAGDVCKQNTALNAVYR